MHALSPVARVTAGEYGLVHAVEDGAQAHGQIAKDDGERRQIAQLARRTAAAGDLLYHCTWLELTRLQYLGHLAQDREAWLGALEQALPEQRPQTWPRRNGRE